MSEVPPPQIRDEDYDNRKAFSDRDDYYNAWAARSAAFRSSVAMEADLRYSDRPRNRLDVICGDPDAPTLFHIHGGFWQWNEKEDYLCCVEAAHAAGLNAVMVEHTLAPEASLADIVAEVRAGLIWFTAHRGEFGIRNPSVIVSGHSSGGHLAAMCHDVADVAGVVLISGLFDLRPITQIYVNKVVGMDDQMAIAHSPQLVNRRYPGFAIVAWGGDELPAFRAQSAAYAEHLIASGNEVEALEVPDHHHFSVLDSLVEPNGLIFQALAGRLDIG